MILMEVVDDFFFTSHSPKKYFISKRVSILFDDKYENSSIIIIAILLQHIITSVNNITYIILYSGKKIINARALRYMCNLYTCIDVVIDDGEFIISK